MTRKKYILHIHTWDKEDTLAVLPSPSIVTQNKNKIKINDYNQNYIHHCSVLYVIL